MANISRASGPMVGTRGIMKTGGRRRAARTAAPGSAAA